MARREEDPKTFAVGPGISISWSHGSRHRDIYSATARRVSEFPPANTVMSNNTRSRSSDALFHPLRIRALIDTSEFHPIFAILASLGDFPCGSFFSYRDSTCRYLSIIPNYSTN
jgi:hypothetical protein